MAKHRVKAKVKKETEARLRRIAKIAQVFVDGDAFKGVPLKPEMNTGDEYLVDHEKFIAVKQTLIKLKQLEVGDIGVHAWRPFKDEMDIVVPVDVYPKSVRPGNYPITPAMDEALKGGTAVQEIDMRGFPLLAVCTPIWDSMGDVVGVTELFASLVPDKFTVNKFKDQDR